MEKINSQDIEIAISGHFNYLANVIVPNISWSFLYYEADMVILRPSGWAIEVEIKTSAQDIKRDLRKKTFPHKSELFRELWFAVPDHLKDHHDIPDQAGIFVVSRYPNGDLRTVTYRLPARNKHARKWTDDERTKLYKLGVMRIWTLKKHLNKKRSRNNGQGYQAN